MKRGSTPTIVIKLPVEFAVDELEDAVFSVAQQNSELISRPLSAMSVSVADNTLSVILTQEETLLLRHNDLAEMQLKIKIKGKVIPTDVVKVAVGKILNEEVL